MHSQLALIERYREYLPITDATPIISLGEGNTPLVKAVNLHRLIGASGMKLYFKLEGLNPTGSFKDRGMTLAISKAVEAGARGVICASTGNTSASAAAFAAKAGLKCYVILPAGHVALGKLAQAILYGAKVIPIEGNFDRALELVREIADDCQVTIVNSINPYRLEGQKTGAFEIIEALGQAPEYFCIPVGNAGNISAYRRGFKQWWQSGKIAKAPMMFGFEAEGAAAIVQGKPIANPETFATAIRIGNPASWQEAELAANESGGLIDSVTDDEILHAYKLLAESEGIFCEPSSAASVAGLIKQLKAGSVLPDALVTCVLTGNGLKDPDSALKSSQVDLTPVKAEAKQLVKAMGL
jgi:threonine synthase